MEDTTLSNQRMWSDSPDKVPTHPKDKYSKGVHFYGGVSANGLTDLIKVQGTVNSEKYIRKVLPHFLKKHKRRKKMSKIACQSKLFKDLNSFILEQMQLHTSQ